MCSSNAVSFFVVNSQYGQLAVVGFFLVAYMQVLHGLFFLVAPLAAASFACSMICEHDGHARSLGFIYSIVSIAQQKVIFSLI